MFDFVRNNRRIVQVVLVAITLPFAFWGVDSYVRNASGGDDVARVGDSRISHQEFLQALQAQQERLRSSMGGRPVPQEMLDAPELREAVINGLIDQHLISLHATKSKLSVTEQQLAQFLASVPALQQDGKFSRERYEAVVAAQNMSIPAFEAQLRQNLTLQQSMGVVALPIVATDSARRWVAAELEEREVTDFVLHPEQFLAQVKLGTDAAKTFYDTNRKQFELPQMARVEYLVLSRAALGEQAKVSEEDISAWYKSHIDQYAAPEERRASHILIQADKSAPEAAVKAAQTKAEALLAELKKNPKEFAALARQNSQDPGSATHGGDLDWFRRGAMVKPFEDAVFSLKEGEISNLVRSDFGFHIILLTGIKPAHTQPLEAVRDQIAAELRDQVAAKKYAEMAEGFGNTVYEQADSLQPAADKFKLKIERSDWIAPQGAAPGPLANPKLRAAIFTDDAIKEHRNTSAIDIGNDTQVAARVVDYKPAAIRPFDEVKAAIEQKLARDEAVKLTRKAGEEQLARLSKGDAISLAWGKARNVPRMGVRDLAPDALRAIFRVDARKLPAYAGTALPDGGYALYRISLIKPWDGKEDDPRAKMLRQQYERVTAGEEVAAWLATLRQRYPVEINTKALAEK
ncbi:MAG: SurA N-terminal domain-containing protein [Proteobacteria bacterium]|nr:SurA N-terminal domain-containing protein [Pseudomonadota bacterium]HQR03208.1 SurA N-terminal domain-containing protein [Rhodocyclaceae bacterium]